MNNRVVVTGMAVCSPFGETPSDFGEGLSSGHTCIRKVDQFDVSQLSCQMAATIPESSCSPVFGKFDRYLTRNTKLLGATCLNALTDAAYSDVDDLGMVLGSNFGNFERSLKYIRQIITKGYKNLRPMDGIDASPNSAMDTVAILIKAKGVHKMTCAGIASSLNAIGSAYHYIKNGKANIILTGGHDNIFPEMMYVSSSKGLLAEADKNGEVLNKPLDKQRSGIILGEGVGILMLENLQHALDRNVKIHAEVMGFGSTYAAPDKPRKRIESASHAICIAMKNARISSNDIDYINSTASGSITEDRIEKNALLNVFRGNREQVPVSSIKGATGECFGVSGAMQSISTIYSIKNNIIPPTLNCYKPILDDNGLSVVIEKYRNHQINKAVINAIDCYGFNSSLIMGRYR